MEGSTNKRARWSEDKQADFATDVEAGMRVRDLADKYQSSYGAMTSRRRTVLIAKSGSKIQHDVTLQRHLGHKVEPERVRVLRADHPAVVEGRTLFPSRRFYADEVKGVLVSGAMNSKIGGKIQKGEWSGFPVFTLTLEERATCPSSCAMFRACYGGGMPFSKRIVNDATFEQVLQLEVAAKAMKHPQGFVVRLHVLGDFYSVEYVKIWRDLLLRFDALHVYGYTARLPEDPVKENRLIGYAINFVKEEFPDRFRIRWSRPGASPDGTTVITYRPDTPRTNEGIVCAAERDMTACCSTCGMCWSNALKDETIVFMLHGPKKR